MTERVHHNPNLIYSVGTQVVVLRDVTAEGGRMLHPRGSVGVVVRAPADLSHSYRVRFLDGIEEPLAPAQVVMLAQFKEGEIGDAQITEQHNDMFSRVIYRCIVGSRAFGLDHDESDTDRRGIYLPPAELQWSLYGVPEQIDREIAGAVLGAPEVSRACAQGESKRARMPLHADGRIDCPWAKNCWRCDHRFFRGWCSRLTTATSPRSSRKCRPTCATRASVKWKHVMHLIRLLLSGHHATARWRRADPRRSIPGGASGRSSRRDQLG